VLQIFRVVWFESAFPAPLFLLARLIVAEQVITLAENWR
jgi:hypothetical protein